MKRSPRALRCAAAVAACLCLSHASTAQSPAEPAPEGRTFALAWKGEDLMLPSDPEAGRIAGIRGIEPPPERAERRRSAAALPTFTAILAARAQRYRVTLVGTDPSLRKPRGTVVPLEIIPVRVELADGTVLDPTLPGPACAGPGTPLDDTLQSPLFTDADYGEGGRQYVEEHRRFEFWAMTAAQPGYSVRVAATVLPAITVTFDRDSTAAPCGRVGVLPWASIDALIRTRLLPLVRPEGVSARTFPLFLFANVMTKGYGSGVFFGYHSAAGAQTYGVAEYDTNGLYKNAADISVLSHELAEWYDDPYVDNPTPSWGHTGQVSGCQSNLEVGDPLSGHLLAIPMPNGLTYHPQELAFFSWFFDQVPSRGIEGRYSWAGTLLGPAEPCG